MAKKANSTPKQPTGKPTNNPNRSNQGQVKGNVPSMRNPPPPPKKKD